MSLKISVILATYNCADLLQDCLDSISKQTYDNIDLVVVDGASTDGTIDIIKRNSRLISHWLSEPDTGIYDAWNKALRFATGDWFYFIGADDELYGSNTIELAASKLNSLDEGILFAYGKVYLTRVNGHASYVGSSWHICKNEMNSYMVIPHQGVFHARKLIETFKGFDERFKVAGDYKLLLQSIQLAAPIFLEDLIVARQYANGISAKRKNRLKIMKEFRKVQVELNLPLTHRWLIGYAKGFVWRFLSYFYDVKA